MFFSLQLSVFKGRTIELKKMTGAGNLGLEIVWAASNWTDLFQAVTDCEAAGREGEEVRMCSSGWQSVQGAALGKPITEESVRLSECMCAVSVWKTGRGRPCVRLDSQVTRDSSDKAA